jgi:hypothetical protein
MRTVAIDTSEVDFMVLGFSCRDSSVLASLGNHSKESRWKVQAGLGTKPFDISVHVDKTVLSSAEVKIEVNGMQVFPSNGIAKSKLLEDFRWFTTFRGTLKNIGVQGCYEVCPTNWGEQHWYRATLVKQNYDVFEVTIQLPDKGGGFRESHLPAVRVENIRESGTKRPVILPQRHLILTVPKTDPLQATLAVDDSKLITHYFARPTPPPGEGQDQFRPKQRTRTAHAPGAEPGGHRTTTATVHFKVNQERTQVVANVGHRTLDSFLKCEPRLVRQDATKSEHTWVLQIGPFAEHEIQVQKKYARSRIVTLTVDGELLAEASADDLDCESDLWECKFRLKGEKCLSFEVFESSRDGITLGTTGVVERRLPYYLDCQVMLTDEKDFHCSELMVAGRPSNTLPLSKAEDEERNIMCTPEALMMQHQLPIPSKIDGNAKYGFERVMDNAYTTSVGLVGAARSNAPDAGFFSRWFTCCDSSVTEDNVTEVHPVQTSTHQADGTIERR